MRLFGLLIAVLTALPTTLVAQSAGLIIANGNYENAPSVRRGERISSAAPAFEQAGMRVISARQASLSDMRDALDEFGQLVRPSEQLFIALSGQFIHTESETYFLPVDWQNGPFSALPSESLPLSTVFAWAATKPGKAVVMLTTGGGNLGDGFLTNSGLGELDIPQGVTVITGFPKATTSLATKLLAQPGKPFVGAAIQSQDMHVLGYAPRTMVLLEGSTPPPVQANDRLTDINDWRAASRENTARSYEAYLGKHPNGEFAQMAQSRLAALTDTPEARAERAEQSLDLNRDARRDIQRDLSLLGFDTRGIDGIFGRGTRAAIQRWQQSERFPATGFMTAEQIALLDEKARIRAEELEAEAEARRQQQLAQDLDYWNQTGSRGDEAGLRAYLKRFPDGEFAELAIERLAIFEQRKRNRANRIDRQLWDEATSQNTAASYERYLVESPNGAFREEAQQRIVAFQREAEFSQAARAEEAMNLSAGTKRIVEARLNGLGLKPGPVDGVFDNDTRRAIRRYQSARKLPQTGYMSDAMMVQLMADTVRQIFR